MKCFSHHSVDAIGICKSCGRGLCPDCLVEIGTACACKNRCESDVESLNDMIQRGTRVYQKTSGIIYRSATFITILGVLFLGYGLFISLTREFNLFLLVIGLVFFLYGVAQFFTAKKYQQK